MDKNILGVVAAISAAVVSLVWPIAGQAADVMYLQGQAPVAQSAITAYGNDLFGDKVSLYPGIFASVKPHTGLPLWSIQPSV